MKFLLTKFAKYENKFSKTVCGTGRLKKNDTTWDGLGEIMTKRQSNRLHEYKWDFLALWMKDLFYRLW